MLTEGLNPAELRLEGEYYSACQQVFRRTTNQSDRMLDKLQQILDGRLRLSVLSVGSGMGLFEIPLLERLMAEGARLDRFVGIDLDQHACQVLRQRLRERFGGRLDFEVVESAFERFQSEERFGLVLFVHTFEYLRGDLVRCLGRAWRMLAHSGRLVLFSPQRGGINAIYEQVSQGSFANDLQRLLEAAGLEYSAEQVAAECTIEPLLDRHHPERVALLSFLTQLDCRQVSADRQDRFSEYFRSLCEPQTALLPHPTTVFTIRR